MRQKTIMTLLLAVLLLVAMTGQTLSAPVTGYENDLSYNVDVLHANVSVTTSADYEGWISLPEDGSRINLQIPESVNGIAIRSIGPEAFRGSKDYRAVLIPSCVTSIGDYAFTDCEGLEYIILQNRYNSDDMTLGERWFGNAQVIFEYELCETVE